MKPTSVLPIAVASILLCAAVAHLGVLAVGARGAIAMGAPSWIVDSLNAGTWLAPTIILCIAAVLAYAAACVLSVASLISRDLPLSRKFVWIFVVALLLRGAALPAIALFVPRTRPDFGLFDIATAIGAALLGMALFVALRRRRPAS